MLLELRNEKTGPRLLYGAFSFSSPSLEPIRKPRRGKAARSEQRSLRPQMSSAAPKLTKHIRGFRIEALKLPQIHCE
jgi:hypothetical protein